MSTMLLLAAAIAVAPVQTDTVDVLIRGGLLMDGSGSAGRVTDVGIAGDRITFVGLSGADRPVARRVIDAEGLVVAPGFIDPHVHAHGDLSSDSFERRRNANYLAQGVTTVIVGNDGHGTPDVHGARKAYEAGGIGTNAALLVGFGGLRIEVMGREDRAPTAAERDEMHRLLDQAMRDGALGMAAGLFYAPQSYAELDEVVDLARIVARYDGVYDTHLRDESSYTIGLLAAVDEAIEIGRRTGVAVNISHVKALGVDVWGESAAVLARMEAAIAEGLSVSADQYPYTASGTSFTGALVPRWAQAGGSSAMQERLADPSDRLIAEMTDNLRRRGGPETLLVTATSNEDLLGMTLADIAAERGLDPVSAAIEVLREGGASVASFNMNEDDIVRFMASPLVMTGSDGSGGHPRKYGSYPRKIRRYVMEQGVISLERMIQASSAQPARVFALEDRGMIREGAFADVIVFDPDEVRDRATFEEPRLLAEGMRWVFVNGRAAIDEGRLTEDLAGRVLARGERAPASGPSSR